MNRELVERLRARAYAIDALWEIAIKIGPFPLDAMKIDSKLHDEAAAALEARGGWVSVKDRLPENFGMRCLVMGTEADTPTSANWNGLTDGSQQYWILDNANVQWTIEIVSHWMPLPAAPKGKP